MSKPVIVLVPGAWHRPQHLHKVIDGLEKSGYEAYGVALVSVDSKPPVTSWDKDAEAVREVIVRNLDADKDVIVIAHSYGGMVMSEAVKGLGKKAREEQGLKAGVLRLIYMCAIAPRKGETLQDKTKPATEEEANLAQQQMQSLKIEEV
jgi:pimeloyl-ACP methyl ester carboxylesterase